MARKENHTSNKAHRAAQLCKARLMAPLATYGGGILCNFSSPLTVRSNPKHTLSLAASLVIALLFMSSCEKDLMRYEEMRQYHQESLTLQQVTTDSVTRFSSKVSTFVASHPAAQEDPLYPEIQENIRLATLRIAVILDEEWGDDKHINF